METLGQRLRRFREQGVVGQAELARKAGLTQPAVWAIEHDRRRPRPATIRKLAAALTELSGRTVTPADLAGVALSDDHPAQ